MAYNVPQIHAVSVGTREGNSVYVLLYAAFITNLKNKHKMSEEKKLSAVEWLAEKYNYVTWMRNRDEISAGMADEWRKHYLDQAKEMEKQQVINAFGVGCQVESTRLIGYQDLAEQYYNENFGVQ
jgi:hypothetical protein